MNTTVLMGDVLFTLQEIAYQLFKSQIPEFGYIFISTTILMFIFELKTTYKLKKLERSYKKLIKELKDRT